MDSIEKEKCSCHFDIIRIIYDVLVPHAYRNDGNSNSNNNTDEFIDVLYMDVCMRINTCYMA